MWWLAEISGSFRNGWWRCWALSTIVGPLNLSRPFLVRSQPGAQSHISGARRSLPLWLWPGCLDSGFFFDRISYQSRSEDKIWCCPCWVTFVLLFLPCIVSWLAQVLKFNVYPIELDWGEFLSILCVRCMNSICLPCVFSNNYVTSSLLQLFA